MKKQCKIDENVAKACTSIINTYRGVYISPDVIRLEQVALAVKLMSQDSDKMLVTAPFKTEINFITEHDQMPDTNEVVAEIHINGVEEPIYLDKNSVTGISFNYHKPYWMLKNENRQPSRKKDKAN